MIVPETARQRRVIAGDLALLVIALVAAWGVPLYRRVAATAGLQEIRPADVIIVFGAAEYSGRPSPTFKARLDHAFELYRERLAPIVIVTGGGAADPQFTEGGVGRDYLIARGIPDNAIIAEMHASDTHQSAERVATIMRANGMHAALAVSDGYHMYRVREMLTDQGITVFDAPRPQAKPLSKVQTALTYLRECLSYTLWKLHLT